MGRGAGEEAMKATGEGGEGEKVEVAEVEGEKMEKGELGELEEEASQEIHQAEEEEGGEVEEEVALHLLSLANPQVGNTLIHLRSFPGGIGGGRKGAEKDWDDGDWDVPLAEPPKALEETEETVNEKFKVEMQRLHMSEENQELLKAALLEVRGELRLRKEKSYKDQGRRLDHGYWLKDNQLLVRGVQDFSEERMVHPSGENCKRF